MKPSLMASFRNCRYASLAGFLIQTVQGSFSQLILACTNSSCQNLTTDTFKRNTPLYLLLAPCFPKQASSWNLEGDGAAFPNQQLTSERCNIRYPSPEESSFCCYLPHPGSKSLMYLPESHLKNPSSYTIGS